MLDTIRGRLFSILLVIAYFSLLLFYLIFTHYFKEKEKIDFLRNRIVQTNILLLEDINLTHRFFENETINSTFYENGESRVLIKHTKTLHDIRKSLNDFSKTENHGSERLRVVIRNMTNELNAYDLHCKQIIALIFQRGFKDFGTEGAMRRHAHQMEKYKDVIQLITILQLRRHEKDFILRQEDSYLKKHSELVASTRSNISANPRVTAAKKKEVLDVLDNYSNSFKQLVELEQKIGIKDGFGLKRSIDVNIANIEQQLEHVLQELKSTEEAKASNLQHLFWFSFGFYIIFFLILAYFISKKASETISLLAKKIDEFVVGNFAKPNIQVSKGAIRTEIDKLAQNFAIMELQIVKQLNELKESNSDLQTLLYRSSHDLRSPLCSIKGLVDIAIQTSDSNDKQYYLLIETCCNNLLRIIDDLSLVTNIKIDSSESETIHFNDLFDSLLSEQRIGPNNKEIQFTTELSLNTAFGSNPYLIKTIFRYLIQNAVNHRIPQNTNSFVHIKAISVSKDYLMIEISDNGKGIKESVKHKVFDIFFKTSNFPDDTGLGLYIVKNSIQKLNGTISFESKSGAGSTFTVVLPNMNTSEKHRLPMRAMPEKEFQLKVNSQSLNYN